MAWDRKTLEECTEYITDGDHQPAPKSDDGVLFIKIKDIKDSRVDFKEALHVPLVYYEGIQRNRKPVLGDTLYTVVGSYGLSAYVNFDIPFCFERNIALLHPKKGVDSRFLFYSVNTPDFFKQAENAANGAAQKLIPLSRLKQLKIQVPPFATQKKIADILSAYDNLIENNQKQIKLLEEAAQRLYKQWFIDLRFPGHETTKIVDGLPEGWRKGIVGEIAEFKRGKVITKAQVAEGNVPVVAGGLEPAYYHNTANTTAPVITVSGSGANAGFAQLYNENVFASDCSFADINTTPYVYFVYCLLKDKKTELDSLQKGAAQPHVYAKDINALATLIPPEEMLKLYTKYASPYFEKVKALKEQIKNLTQSRDRLLPKLMNGELEV